MALIGVKSVRSTSAEGEEKSSRKRPLQHALAMREPEEKDSDGCPIFGPSVHSRYGGCTS